MSETVLPLYFSLLSDSEAYFYIHHAKVEKVETTIHSHNKGQLLYAEGGIVHVFVDGKHWYLPARCYMWIPPNTPHAIMSNSKYVSLYNFYFTIEEMDSEFYKDTNIYFASDLLRQMMLYSKDWEGAIKKFSGTAYNFLMAIKSIIPELKSNIVPFSVQHPYPNDPKLLSIAQFLVANINENYSIEDIAQRFGLSVRSLSRKFKEQLGMSYVRFLRSLRITKSLELIAENKLNMYEVALAVGYSSLSAYSTIFYRITGIRPSEYAQRLRK